VRSIKARTSSSPRYRAITLPTKTINHRVLPVCYIRATMACEIVLAPEAVEDLRVLKANVRAAVRRALEIHLRG
jgi:hypothetical protein